MERVDVVIVGQGVVALAAAARAANDGVRVIVVDRGPRLADAASLLRVSAEAIQRLGVDPAASERALGPSADGSEDHAVASAAVGQAMERRAWEAGVSIRSAIARTLEVRLEAGGWLVAVEGGEPIRAPLLVLADDARAALMDGLGLSQAQRTTADGAEIATFAAATWRLPPSELGKHSEAWIRAGKAPLTRAELIPGRDRVTLRVGPVWAAERGDPAHPAVVQAVARAARKLGLPATPTNLEIEEVRLDALPCPSTFDGGIIIGAGAGQASRVPGHGIELDAELGAAAGSSIARAILGEKTNARDLAVLLDAPYRALVARVALPAPTTPQRPVFARFARPRASA